MPSKPMTEEEKTRAKIKRQTKEYMDGVVAFIEKNNNGAVPTELGASIQMLEAYYSQFLQLNAEIEKMDTFIVPSRYGLTVSPILTARDKTVQKLDMILKSLGCTFKEQTKMKVVEPVKEESPLEKFVKGKIEQR